jgi:hypothetical protein
VSPRRSPKPGSRSIDHKLRKSVSLSGPFPPPYMGLCAVQEANCAPSCRDECRETSGWSPTGTARTLCGASASQPGPIYPRDNANNALTCNPCSRSRPTKAVSNTPTCVWKRTTDNKLVGLCPLPIVEQMSYRRVMDVGRQPLNGTPRVRCRLHRHPRRTHRYSRV